MFIYYKHFYIKSLLLININIKYINNWDFFIYISLNIDLMKNKNIYLVIVEAGNYVNSSICIISISIAGTIKHNF